MSWIWVIIPWVFFVQGAFLLAWKLHSSRRDEESDRDRFGAGRRG